MKLYIYRNSTVENLFNGINAEFSGYGEFSNYPNDADYYVFLYTHVSKFNHSIDVNEIESYYNKLLMIVRNLPINKKILVFTLSEITNSTLLGSDFRIKRAIAEFNENIYKLAEQNRNVIAIDFASFCSKFPDIYAPKFYFYSMNVINPKYSKEFKNWFLNQIRQVEGIRKKCIVLDLDNTLWGGVVGEDGLSGIQIGNTYPGNVFRYFQEQILAVRNTGILLALCSKNNHEDAAEVFQKHPDMILKFDDFIIQKINWNNKADNIRTIAEELNIGLDAMVFIDDNPTERELVRLAIPEIIVPEFPKQVHQIPSFFEQVYDEYFKVYTLTDEDKVKNEQYQIVQKAIQEKEQFQSIDEYLLNLEIEITIQQVSEITLPRASQLTQKTNQFNLTTKRYTESELSSLLNNGGMIYLLSVRDKFGDSGICGEVIIKYENDSAVFDSFMMSCRVLGKKIEYTFLNEVLAILRSMSIKYVYANYIKSNKNQQVSEFYDKNKFDVILNSEEEKKYKIDLNDYANFEPKLMKVIIC